MAKQATKKNIEKKPEELRKWDFISDSIHFWSFKDYPQFIGRYKCEYNSDEFNAFVFIEEETQAPWLIAQNKAVVAALNKEKEAPDKDGVMKKMKLVDCPFAIYKIQFVGQVPLKGGKSFNRYNIHVTFDELITD